MNMDNLEGFPNKADNMDKDPINKRIIGEEKKPELDSPPEYGENIEISKDSKNVIERHFSQEIGGAKKELAEFWIGKNGEELRKEGIDVENLNDPAKVKLFEERGVLEQLREKEEYKEKIDNISNIESEIKLLQKGIEEDSLPVEAGALILNRLYHKAEKLRENEVALKGEAGNEEEIARTRLEIVKLWQVMAEITGKFHKKDLAGINETDEDFKRVVFLFHEKKSFINKELRKELEKVAAKRFDIFSLPQEHYEKYRYTVTDKIGKENRNFATQELADEWIRAKLWESNRDESLEDLDRVKMLEEVERFARSPEDAEQGIKSIYEKLEQRIEGEPIDKKEVDKPEPKPKPKTLEEWKSKAERKVKDMVKRAEKIDEELEEDSARLRELKEKEQLTKEEIEEAIDIINKRTNKILNKIEERIDEEKGIFKNIKKNIREEVVDRAEEETEGLIEKVLEAMRAKVEELLKDILSKRDEEIKEIQGKEIVESEPEPETPKTPETLKTELESSSEIPKKTQFSDETREMMARRKEEEENIEAQIKELIKKIEGSEDGGEGETGTQETSEKQEKLKRERQEKPKIVMVDRDPFKKRRFEQGAKRAGRIGKKGLAATGWLFFGLTFLGIKKTFQAIDYFLKKKIRTKWPR